MTSTKVIPLKKTPRAACESFLKRLKKGNVPCAALVWLEETDSECSYCVTPLTSEPNIDQLRLMLYDVFQVLSQLKYGELEDDKLSNN